MKCSDCGHELKENGSSLKCINKKCQRNIIDKQCFDYNRQFCHDCKEMIYNRERLEAFCRVFKEELTWYDYWNRCHNCLRFSVYEQIEKEN